MFYETYTFPTADDVSFHRAILDNVYHGGGEQARE